MKIIDLRNQVTEEANKLWSKYIDGMVTTAYSGITQTLFLTFYMASDKEQFPNGISNNDPIELSVMLAYEGDNIVMEYARSSVTRLKPEDKIYAMATHKIRTRKAKGDVSKVMKSLEKTMAKVAEFTKEAATNDQFLPLNYDPVKKVKV